MKQEIKDWLSGPRKYTEGIALYEKYGTNKVLKQNFAKRNSSEMMDTLVYELVKLAGISEKELKGLKRLATVPKTSETQSSQAATPDYIDDLFIKVASHFGVSVDGLLGNSEITQLPDEATDEQIKLISVMVPKYASIPDAMKEMIRFRERYPFLKEPTCPVELKAMVTDMFSAYDQYREAYAALSEENTQDENFLLAQQVVEKYLDNKLMWKELDHYKDKGEILGEHPIFETLKRGEELKAVADIDLNKKLNNAKANITKSKNAVASAKTDEKKAEAQTRLQSWETIHSEILAEIERRKK